MWSSHVSDPESVIDCGRKFILKLPWDGGARGEEEFKA